MVNSQTVAGAALTIVMLCWIAFAGTFLFRKRPPSAREKKRDPSARYGILLEAAGLALVWSFRRPMFTPLFSLGLPLEIALAFLTMICAVTSTILVSAAVRTLGRQWAFSARLIDNHTLMTSGPYGIVRNPIYAGMFGMMIATGIALSRWWALPPAIVLFLIGTHLRVTSEEKLLRGAFGNEFEEYAQRVPPFIPLVVRRRTK